MYRLASTDNPGISGVSGESMKGHWTTDGVLGQPWRAEIYIIKRLCVSKDDDDR